MNVGHLIPDKLWFKNALTGGAGAIAMHFEIRGSKYKSHVYSKTCEIEMNSTLIVIFQHYLVD